MKFNYQKILIQSLIFLILATPFILAKPKPVLSFSTEQKVILTRDSSGAVGKYDVTIYGFEIGRKIAMRLFANGQVVDFGSDDNVNESENFFLQHQASPEGICDKSAISSDQYFANLEDGSAAIELGYGITEVPDKKHQNYTLDDASANKADPNKKFVLEVFFSGPTCPSGTTHAGKIPWIMMSDKGLYPEDSGGPEEIDNNLRLLGTKMARLRDLMLGNAATNTAAAPTYPEDPASTEPDNCTVDPFLPPTAGGWKVLNRNRCTPVNPPETEGNNDFWSPTLPISGSLWNAAKQELTQRLADVVKKAIEDNFNFNVSTDTQGLYLTEAGDRRMTQIDAMANSLFNTYSQLESLSVTDQQVIDANIVKRHKDFQADDVNIKYTTWAGLKSTVEEMRTVYQTAKDLQVEVGGMCMEKITSKEINILSYIACLISKVADGIIALAIEWMQTFAGI